MKNKLIIKGLMFGTIFILLTLSIVPINASKTTNDQKSCETQSANQYILGEIRVGWDYYFKQKPFIFNITFNNQTEFEFPEINGTIQTNFTVVFMHRLENRLIFPRWTKAWILVWQGNNYIWNIQTPYYRCKDLKWEYHNITLNAINWIYSPVANQSIYAMIGVGGFPTHLWPNASNVKEFSITIGSDP